MESHHAINGKIHYNWPFSIANCNKLPEGKHPFSYGFPMVFPSKPPFSSAKSIDSQELVAEPHTMLVLLNSRWEYSYTPSGESLALQSFMLSEPAIYCLEDRGTSGRGSWVISHVPIFHITQP